VQEAFNVALTPAFVTMLEDAQMEARRADPRGGGLAEIVLNDVAYRMRAKGTRGSRWVLENGDVLLMIAAPGTNWPLSVRYLSGAIWRDGGVEKMRIATMQSLDRYAMPADADFVRLTRADYCFDFYSPEFTEEHQLGVLSSRWVCHSSCKKSSRGVVAEDIGRTRGETSTAGSKSNVQVQIYDKSLEITEASGKEWLYRLWAPNADGEVLKADVWRLEVRFGSEFFKARNIKRPHELAAMKRQVVVEALFALRQVVPVGGDSNKRRWPVHPLWSEAIRRCGTLDMVPIDRKVTGRRDALIKQSCASIAGSLRSHCMLKFQRYTRDEVIAELNEIIGILEDDPKHPLKLEQAELRYSDVEDPK
jgi:hypothetical protein